MAEQRTRKESLLKRIKDARLLRGRVDFSVLLVITALCAFGLVMIFSASYYYAQHYSGANNDSFYYLKKQLVYLLIGYPVMLLISLIDYRIIERLRSLFLAISLILLVAVLIWGENKNGGKRWLNVGISIQPSELAKFGLMIFMCSYMSRHKNEMNTFRFGMLPMLIAIGSIAGLVMLQPNMSMAVIIGFIGVVLLYLGGCNLKHLLILGAVGIVAVIYLAFSKSYRADRMTSFSNPETDPLGSGYQLLQSFYAIGSGGFSARVFNPLKSDEDAGLL